MGYGALSYAVFLFLRALVEVAFAPLHLEKMPVSLIGFVILVPFLCWQAAFAIKRLHDLNTLGWWALLWFAPLVCLELAVDLEPSLPSVVLIVIGWSSLVLWMWIFIQLGFQHGTQGENRYGPPPPWAYC